jgi:hypothetical protein
MAGAMPVPPVSPCHGGDVRGCRRPLRRRHATAILAALFALAVLAGPAHAAGSPRQATRVRIRLSAVGHQLGLAAVRLSGARISGTVHTDAHGRATLRVKPTRAGIVSVTASKVARCTRKGGVADGATLPQFTG